MSFKTDIQKEVGLALRELGEKPIEYQIEHPADLAHGDYAVNVALVLGGGRPLAEKIAAKLHESNLKNIVSEIKVEGPGFINISIRNDGLITQVDKLLSGDLHIDQLKGQKIMVEYTDPNPFKEMHIGHLYSNIVGESICRLFEAVGAKVKRVCYQGDVGLHVAKAVWGMDEKMTKDKLTLADLAKKSLDLRQKFMGEAYAVGAKAYEADKTSAKDIEMLNKKIYEGDKGTRELYETGRAWSLEYFETIYKRLGTKFDHYFFESQVGPEGLKLVGENIGKVFAKSEGAIVFQGETVGLHTRVFVNKLGLPTYEAKDLGLAPLKFKTWAYDQSLIITANEVSEYFKVVFAALKQILPDLAAKTSHLGHGLVKLPEGKMSSRTGNILTAEWLLNAAKKEAQKLNQDEAVAEQVGKAAVKYALLKTTLGQDVVFDLKTSVSFDGNSGPYLQYTYARCHSVIDKYGKKVKSVSVDKLADSESSVLRTLYRFDEVVRQSAKELSPNIVANFLYDLAQKFNYFYNVETILKAKPDTKEFRVWLTYATAEIIKRGLDLLGISAPREM